MMLNITDIAVHIAAFLLSNELSVVASRMPTIQSALESESAPGGSIPPVFPHNGTI